MKRTPATLRLAIVQFSAGPDPERNLGRLEELWPEADKQDLVALPENFLVRGGLEDYHRAAESIPGPLTARLARLAVRTRSWVLAGSLVERTGDRIYNTTVLFDPRGEIRATYRKIHLFEATLDDGTVIREQDWYRPGVEPVLTSVGEWRAGLSICYDLRFPELFRLYSARGADLFFVPANFTQRTGRDHWEVLLRARAIENQCFVVAPAQCGVNERTGVASYGHSLVAGPWGELLGAAGEAQEVLYAELDPALLERTRSRVAVLQHRRI